MILKLSDGQLFLKLDYQLAHLAISNFTNAFDILFKVYQVLNLVYLLEAELFYKVMKIIYDIDDKKIQIFFELVTLILNFGKMI